MFYRIVLLLLTLLVSTPVHGVKRSGALAAFHQDTIDVGTLKSTAGFYDVVFEYENTGTQPLVVLSARTSCSCMKAKFSRKPLPIGGHGSITVTIETAKMDIGSFHRVVQVRTNAGVSLLAIQGQIAEG